MHAKLIDGQNLHKRYKIRTNECAGNFFFPLHIVSYRGLEVFLQTTLLLKRVEDSYLLAHVNYLCIPSSYCYLSHNNNGTLHWTDLLCKHVLRLRHLQ